MLLRADWRENAADVETVRAVVSQAIDTAAGSGDSHNARHEYMFNPWLWSNHPFVRAISDNLLFALEDHEPKRQRRRKQADKENREKAMRTIVANLAYVAMLGVSPPAVGISLRASKQKKTRYDRDGYSGLRNLIDLLSKTFGVVEIHKSSIKGVASAIVARKYFVEDMARFKRKPDNFVFLPGRETVYLGRVERDFTGKEESRELIDYQDTPDTERYRAEMSRINDSLAASDFGRVDCDERPIATGVPFLRRHFTLPPDAPGGTERFDLGGRLFGGRIEGWWQDLPSLQRHSIRISGEPIADLDFASMYLRLAYLRIGAEPPAGDLYAGLPNLADPRWRPGVKKVVSAMLFRRTPLTRIPRGTSGELPPGISGAQIRSDILAAHPALAPILETGVGLSLMFTESEVIVKALLALVDQRITALPMHDGLMVARSKADKAARIMGDAAEAVVGHRLPISLKSLY